MALAPRRAVRASLAAAASIAFTVLAACGALRTGEDGGDGAPAGFGNGSPDGATASGGDGAATAHEDGGTKAGDGGVKGDAAPPDAGSSASSGLDPGVAIPALDQQACSRPGAENECPFLHPCRIATPDAGRCDDCVAQGTCAGGVKSVCQTNRDCDILFQCFRNRCTLFCSLPNGPECGGTPGTCIDVGHVTTGLCDPAKL